MRLQVVKHTHRLYATASRRGGEAGKPQVTASVIKPGTDSKRPASTGGNRFFLLTVAGYVVADILPSSTTSVQDFFEEVVQFGRNSVLDDPQNPWKPLASADPEVQRAAGAAMGVLASRLIRPIVPAAVRLAIAAFVAGHARAVLCGEGGEKWCETKSNANEDSWMRSVDAALDRWCMCVGSAIEDPSNAYKRIRHSVDSLLRRELAVPPHVANGMIGGAVVGLMVAGLRGRRF